MAKSLEAEALSLATEFGLFGNPKAKVEGSLEHPPIS